MASSKDQGIDQALESLQGPLSRRPSCKGGFEYQIYEYGSQGPYLEFFEQSLYTLVTGTWAFDSQQP